MTNSDTYQAALEYARRGWSLVALHWITAAGQCSCGAAGCKSAGKHPIDKGWQRLERGDTPARWATPAGEVCNIGIRTGTPSGHWVLDFDPADADYPGLDLAKRLEVAGLEPHVRTGGGGLHFRFALEPGQIIRNRQSAGGGAGRTHDLPPGWDVRGEGGQVVAPPSVSGKGAYVELDDGMHVSPAWLLEMVAPPDRMIPDAVRAVGGPTGVGGPVADTAFGVSSHQAERVQAYCT
ncbi:MAG: bifunctional DNA primase/polymerase, partial [Chloroflexota bacterium]